MTLAMLCSRLLSRWMAGLGPTGLCLTSILFVLSSNVPASFDPAMAFAMTGGLTLLAYQLLLAQKFYQLSC